MRPPTAAAVNGTAIPRMPASTMSDEAGRARATIPEANCGANRVMVAAAVKASAPSAPNMKPSNDSRVDGRAMRTTTTGSSMTIMLPTGMPSPSRRIRPPAIPVPNGTPYERATTAPVSSTQPTPSPMPSAAVRSSVAAGRSRSALVSRRYSRKRSGSPSAATVISAAGIRNVANVTRPISTSTSATRNGMRDRCGSCGNSELASDGSNRCSPGAAPYVRSRNQDGPSPGLAVSGSPHSPQYSPAGTSIWQTRHSIIAGASSAGVVMPSTSAGRGCSVRGCRRPGCRGRSPCHIRASHRPPRFRRG